MVQRVLVTTLLFGLLATTALAQPTKSDPDWPCAQLYNPDLVLAHAWSGPDPATAGGHWAADPEIAPLVPRLASTALPLEKALAELDALIARLPAAERPRRLSLLLAGLHEALDSERKKTISGLVKLGRSQKALARAIRERNDRLLELRARANGSEEARELEETLQWDLKIFQDRRATVNLACAQPDTIEKRFFALAKRIEAALAPNNGG
jgi:hypothetical protein